MGTTTEIAGSKIYLSGDVVVISENASLEESKVKNHTIYLRGDVILYNNAQKTEKEIRPEKISQKKKKKKQPEQNIAPSKIKERKSNYRFSSANSIFFFSKVKQNNNAALDNQYKTKVCAFGNSLFRYISINSRKKNSLDLLQNSGRELITLHGSRAPPTIL